MKRLLVLFVGIMTVMLYFCSSVSAELTLQYHDDDCSFYSLFFLDSDYGWASGVPNTLVRTTDGGNTWSYSYLPDREEVICDLHFVSKDVGFCMAGAYPSAGIALYNLFLTKDGGKSWDKSIGLPDSSVVTNSFYDENIGWAGCWISGVWRLYRTTDGGASWSIKREEEETYMLELLDIACNEENTCWVLHGKYYGTTSLYSYTYLDVTRDDGQNWEQVYEARETSYRSASRISLSSGSDTLWLLGRVSWFTFLPSHGYSILKTTSGYTEDFWERPVVWNVASYESGQALFHFHEHPDYENHDCFLYTSDYGRTLEQFYVIPSLYSEDHLIPGFSTPEKDLVWFATTKGDIYKYTPDSVHVQEKSTEIHSPSLILFPPSPNPFNASTTINYTIAQPGNVSLAVYSVSGQKVATLVDGFMPAGTHTAVFNGSSLASGLYLYRFEATGFAKTGKIVLVK